MTNSLQKFNHVDVLRLEVQKSGVGLVNLIPNSTGELGGWGWITPVAGSKVSGVPGTDAAGPAIAFNAGTGASYLTTEFMPVTAGQYVGAKWNISSTSGVYFRARFEYFNAAQVLLASGTQTALATSLGDYTIAATQTPVNTAFVRLRFDFYTSTGTSPTVPIYIYIRRSVVAKAATAAALGVTRTNALSNPSFETTTNGWASPNPFEAGTISTLTRTAVSGAPHGSYACEVWNNTGGFSGLFMQTTDLGLNTGVDYTFSGYLKGIVGTHQIQFSAWHATPSGTVVQVSHLTTTTSNWQRHQFAFTVPGNATSTYLRVAANGGAAAGSKVQFDAMMLEEGFTFDQPFIVGALTNQFLGVVDYGYQNIIGPTHEIKINREGLNLGTLSAEVLDTSLDPATAGVIRPGRKCRLLVLSGGKWESLASGKITQATVRYALQSTDPRKVARISITAVDNTAAVANANRPDGVATIAELPYVLEGAGVPWSVNGNGNQVPSATVVSNNDNASALDQVAITRDSRSGYAWVDRNNVMQAWDAASLPSGAVATLNESVYSDLDVAFSTGDCINEVVVKNVEWDPADPTKSVEVVYGPYRDAVSQAEWGRYSAEFTTHGLTAGQVATLGATVLTKNATPAVRINAVQIPILTTTDLAPTRALIDLYNLVQLVNTGKALNHQAFVTGVEHTITNDGWLMRLGFSKETGVAAPQVTPPVQSTGNGGAPSIAVGGESGWISTSNARKANGVVTVKVAITRDGSSGTGAANTAAAIVPAGARPLDRYYFGALDATSGGPVPMYVDTDGGLKFVFAQTAGSSTLGAFSYVVGA